jgi:protein-S-isoprenylcysteine O-methyltransferase Ste14
MGQRISNFLARGGLWVLAQVPVLAGGLVLPWYTGTEVIDTASFVVLTGIVLTALGVALLTAGIVALGRDLTPFPRPLGHAQLHRRGVYALVRHPIYAGLIIASLGWALTWQSFAGIVFTLFVFMFFDRKSAYEETFLRARYSDYGDYCARVRKLVPLIY